MSKIKCLLIIIIFSIFYSIHFFILRTISKIIQKPISIRTYTLPIVMMIILSFSTQTSYSISKRCYSYIYFMSTAYLGLIIYIFIFCTLYRILNRLYPIKSIYSNLILAIICPLLLIIYGIINANRVTVDKTVRIRSKQYKANKPTLIAHLSDLHLGAVYQKDFVQKICDVITNKILPDIIVITGDLFDSSMKPEIEWLEPFNNINVPILYITGNHEELIGLDDVMKVINKSNIIHIGNKMYELKGKNVNFIGVDYGFNLNKKLEEINIKTNQVNIVISHVPNIHPNELERFNILMYLCGHTHGGQMFPMHLTSYLSSKYFKGLYKEKGKYVYVSEGLGTALFPIRIGSFSRIGVIKIEKE